MSRFIILMVAFVVSGCVKVDDGQRVTPSTPDTADQFVDADKDLVAKLLAASELNDPQKLRRYAALYKANALLLENQQEIPLPKILSGISKATATFITPRSPALQKIVVGLMPESGGAEEDRTVIAKRFASLSLACHAAANQIDTTKK